MKVRVPGKLILSGEHAVVYGAPALAMAVNRYVVATATPQRLPIISFDLSDLSYQCGLSLTALRHLRDRIYQEYDRFRRGDGRIRDVLRKSHELAQFVFTFFLESVKRRQVKGVRIHLESDIPVGCGMGSSAATILGVSYALAHFLQMDVQPEFYLKLGLEAENMQHGRSSGLDLKVCMRGGCMLVDGDGLHDRNISTLPLYLVNTGVPETSTGECVERVAHHFTDTGLLNAFSDVTRALDAALVRNDFLEVASSIKANQCLLARIGVVPKCVQAFIDDVEQNGGSAKVCGAGAVSGARGGMVLVATQALDVIQAIVARHRFTMQPVMGEARGVHYI